MLSLNILLFFLFAALLLAFSCWWVMRAFARTGGKPRGALIAAGLAGVSVLGIYLLIGSPGLEGGAYADRMAALKERDAETYNAEENVAVLSEIARNRPTDAQPLLYLGDIEAQIGRAEPALRAYEEALRRDPNSAEAMIGMGRVLFAMSRGDITPQARALFERASERAPQRPEPFFYQALAAQQEGRADDARRLWRETLARLPENDPRREMVNRMLETQ